LYRASSSGDSTLNRFPAGDGDDGEQRVHRAELLALLRVVALYRVRLFKEEANRVAPVDWRYEVRQQMMKRLRTDDDLALPDSDLEGGDQVPELLRDAGEIGFAEFVDAKPF
jgi:hypothetical protein